MRELESLLAEPAVVLPYEEGKFRRKGASPTPEAADGQYLDRAFIRVPARLQ
jgi:hypothetical protein